MAIGKQDKESLEVWRRNEGKTNLNKNKGGAPIGNTNAFKNGIFVNKCLDGEEKALFEEVVSKLIKELKIEGTTDLMQTELAALYFLKTVRAVKSSQEDAAERLDKMLRMHLRDLKATRIVREESNKNIGNSPAEWISAFMSSYQDKKNAK